MYSRYETFKITDDLLTPLEELSIELPTVTPPDWAVRMVAVNQGKRTGVKYPQHTEIVYANSLHAYHQTRDHVVDPRGPWARPSCNPTKTYASYETPSQSKIVDKGNLPEDDYRFWRGTMNAGISHAMCRWCGQWSDSPLARKAHFRGKSNQQCSNKLRALINWARKNHKFCFACGSYTYKERWGIPLCDREICIRKWKFSNNTDLYGYTSALKDGVKTDALAGYSLSNLMPVLRAALL